MRKFLIRLLPALALALVAAPAYSAEECDAPKPDDFLTVKQNGLFGSYELELWPGLTTVCGHLVVREDGTVFFSTGTERMKSDGRVVLGPQERYKGRITMHEMGFLLAWKNGTLTAFFRTSDPDRLSGQVAVPQESRGYFMTARRIKPQTAQR